MSVITLQYARLGNPRAPRAPRAPGTAEPAVGHRCVSERTFREHLGVLAANAEIIDLRVALRHGMSLEKSKNRYIAISLDDGYIESSRLAQEALRDHGCQATVFVCAAHCDAGAPFWWDALEVAGMAGGWRDGTPADLAETRRALRGLRYADAVRKVRELVVPQAWQSCPDRPATWEQLRGLDSRFLTVASHGWWHESLRLLSMAELRRDLSAAAAGIAASGLPSAQAIAYPFGLEGFVTWEQIREVVGLYYCYGLVAGPRRPPRDEAETPLALHRFPVEDVTASTLLDQVNTIFGEVGA